MSGVAWFLAAVVVLVVLTQRASRRRLAVPGRDADPVPLPDLRQTQREAHEELPEREAAGAGTGPAVAPPWLGDAAGRTAATMATMRGPGVCTPRD